MTAIEIPNQTKLVTVVEFNEDAVLVDVTIPHAPRVMGYVDNGAEYEGGPDADQWSDIAGAFGYAVKDVFTNGSQVYPQESWLTDYIDAVMHNHADAMGHGEGDTLASDVMRSVLRQVNVFEAEPLTEGTIFDGQFGQEYNDQRTIDLAAKYGMHPDSNERPETFLSDCATTTGYLVEWIDGDLVCISVDEITKEPPLE